MKALLMRSRREAPGRSPDQARAIFRAFLRVLERIDRERSSSGRMEVSR